MLQGFASFSFLLAARRRLAGGFVDRCDSAPYASGAESHHNKPTCDVVTSRLL